MDGLRLDGLTALVTGASQGIGAEVAVGFAQRGARVLLTARASDDQPPASLARALAVGAAAYRRLDVTDRAGCDRAVATCHELFGGLDIVVANAGIYPQVPFDAMTPAQWDEMLATNLTGTFNICHAAVPTMIAKGWGKLLLVSSVNVRIVQAQRAHYIASKAGLIGFTRGLARDLGRYGVRANCILPGAILTEGELRDFPDQAAVTAMLDGLQCLPGRITCEMIEPTFAFLASPASDAITGQSLAVDHGWSFGD